MLKTQIRLTGDREAFLVAPYPLSLADFEHIEKWLELMRNVLVVEHRPINADPDEGQQGER